MKNNNLLCTSCGIDTATHLVCFKKYHRESGKWSLIDPNLYCDECTAVWVGNTERLFENQPLLINFRSLAGQFTPQQATAKIGWLTSRKKWEYTQLNTKFWRDKLWNALYWWRGELNRVAHG